MSTIITDKERILQIAYRRHEVSKKFMSLEYSMDKICVNGSSFSIAMEETTNKTPDEGIRLFIEQIQELKESFSFLSYLSLHVRLLKDDAMSLMEYARWRRQLGELIPKASDTDIWVTFDLPPGKGTMDCFAVLTGDKKECPNE